MKHRFNFTHCDRSYTCALFVPSVTPKPDAKREHAHLPIELDDELCAEVLATGAEKIHGNTFGTFFSDEHTTVEDVGWGNERYLEDTPLPMTAGKWWEMFEVLPPMNHRSLGPVETFQVIEAQTGSIHHSFLKFGNAYWAFYGVRGEPIQDLHKRLLDGVAAQARRRYATVEPLKHGKCACCGARILHRQWWNQDEGYGVCNSCLPRYADTAGENLTRMEFLFGLQGYHYSDILGDEV